MTVAIQILAAFACFLLAVEQIGGVVNSSSKQSFLGEDAALNNVTSAQTPAADVPDSQEQESTRREAAIKDIYNGDFLGNGLDSYAPPPKQGPVLPIPVYGVPHAPSNDIVYPAPPPDIPPPFPSKFSRHTFARPFNTFGLSHSSAFDGLKISDSSIFSPPPPPTKYFHPPPLRGLKPNRVRPQLNVPFSKPLFASKLPKPVYGPPKHSHGFGKPFGKHQSVTIITVPSKDHDHLGLQGIQHGPHAGVPAPPTPPDIKYDGWQPIPGLVSKPPSEHHDHYEIDHGNLHSDLIPPPTGYPENPSNGYSSQGVKDSYGAPLNTVTGSGAIVTTSGEAHHDSQSLSLGLSAAGINSNDNLSVIKSIEYEIYPNPKGNLPTSHDTYTAPPLSSYSANGPYAASHSYTSNLHLSAPQVSGTFNDYSTPSTFGLIPPSGVYGLSSNNQFGTPLPPKPSAQYGTPLNALNINPPQRPVIFREPVPTGLIESIGQHTSQKDSFGLVQNLHTQTGLTYLPPPVPEVKPVKEEEPQVSNLYSLPTANPAVAFNSLEFGSGHTTSYTAPLSSIDGSYGLPAIHLTNGFSNTGPLTVGIDNSHPPLTIDLTSSTSNLNPISHAFGYHDCRSHQFQQLSSLPYASNVRSLSDGTNDLQTAHSTKVTNIQTGDVNKTSSISINSISDTTNKNYAKQFGSYAELNENIDPNNIPVQGALGSYTLQIQPAESLGHQQSVSNVSHAHVLSDGLLHSIINAIEQPQRKDDIILGRPVQNFGQWTNTPDQVQDEDDSLRFIQDNKVALYFNSNLAHKSGSEDVRNGQQYGNFATSKNDTLPYQPSSDNTQEVVEDE